MRLAGGSVAVRDWRNSSTVIWVEDYQSCTNVVALCEGCWAVHLISGVLYAAKETRA